MQITKFVYYTTFAITTFLVFLYYAVNMKGSNEIIQIINLLIVSCYFGLNALLNIVSDGNITGSDLKDFIQNSLFQISFILAGSQLPMFIAYLYAGSFFGSYVTFIQGICLIYSTLYVISLYVDLSLFNKSQGKYSQGKILIMTFVLYFVISLVSILVVCVLDYSPLNFWNTMWFTFARSFSYYFSGLGVYCFLYLFFAPGKVTVTSSTAYTSI